MNRFRVGEIYDLNLLNEDEGLDSDVSDSNDELEDIENDEIDCEDIENNDSTTIQSTIHSVVQSTVQPTVQRAVLDADSSSGDNYNNYYFTNSIWLQEGRLRILLLKWLSEQVVSYLKV